MSRWPRGGCSAGRRRASSHSTRRWPRSCAAGWPAALLLRDPRTGEEYTAPASLRVHPSTDVADALQRALTRPAAQRFDPVVRTDPGGHVRGLLRIEDLASAARSRDPVAGRRPTGS